MHEELKDLIEELLEDESVRSLWVSKAGMLIRDNLGSLHHEAYLKAYAEHEHYRLCSLDKGYVVKTRRLVRDCYEQAIGGKE